MRDTQAYRSMKRIRLETILESASLEMRLNMRFMS